ncbi:MAG: DoxX family protein [Phormidesmis sp. RL_2_1]|nr:DoxX family protein [Phormidesmis sp. RL_2_1]
MDTAIALLSGLYPEFIAGPQGYMLLIFRAVVGLLFILHGLPKIKNLKTWSAALGAPLPLCMLSASFMLMGGTGLILGVLTPFSSISILVSMLYALVLEIINGDPLVAPDPYELGAFYEGPDGRKGEPPSMEKALMFSVMLSLIIVFGPGAYSVDALLLRL